MALGPRATTVREARTDSTAARPSDSKPAEARPKLRTTPWRVPIADIPRLAAGNRQGIALELFSGSGRFSSAWRRSCRLQGIAIYEVDIQWGDGCDLSRRALQRRIRGWVRSGLVVAVWLGTPCTSFSRARERKNFKNVLPLRSAVYPAGVPGLPPRLLAQVIEGNGFARFSASLMMLCSQLGVPAVVENPYTSRLWLMPGMLAVARLSTCRNYFTDYCQDGTAWRKRTRFLAVNVDLSQAVRKCCGQRGGICAASGCPHVHLEGRQNGQLMSKLAEPYPAALCNRLVACFAAAIKSKIGSFLASYVRPD